ncbi:hypothetical protein AVT69_gp279 [Pseudomonas phage PhiPA3]|uniref:Uncharacterized protein 281 n=1 Tax=Pseudomonas phage PhiPA3 TaxID=998086 RepID=F8SJB7_BPPA3|nr:hypothetical protein AVT69_gp279 [Pseudomonas phage PhiPA3]AEH03704.1 hypothetical protein [Pseudomonas phage PhiPA3]
MSITIIVFSKEEPSDSDIMTYVGAIPGLSGEDFRYRLAWRHRCNNDIHSTLFQIYDDEHHSDNCHLLFRNGLVTVTTMTEIAEFTQNLQDEINFYSSNFEEGVKAEVYSISNGDTLYIFPDQAHRVHHLLKEDLKLVSDDEKEVAEYTLLDKDYELKAGEIVQVYTHVKYEGVYGHELYEVIEDCVIPKRASGSVLNRYFEKDGRRQRNYDDVQTLVDQGKLKPIKCTSVIYKAEI